VRRSAALVVLVAALAGCSANALTDGSGTRSQPTHSPAAPAERIVAAPRSTPPAPKPKPKPKLRPKPNVCAGNAVAQLVLVSVTQQHLWLCAHQRLVYSAPVTTGAVELPYDSTPTGTFEIQGKTTDTTLTLLSGQTYAVKYWIPFDGPLFGFHDSSWQTFPYGSPRYRTEGSHGCIHTPLAAMKFLHDWAAVGATVLIRA
jgi:hypothetical protein